jgi:hypothetical protein
MTKLIRSELYKFMTTSGGYVLILVTALLTALGIITAFINPVQNGGGDHFGLPIGIIGIRDLIGAGYTPAILLAPIVGVICVTTEFRHKLITTTLLIEPHRNRVIFAKVVASVLWALLLCVASFVMVAAMGLPLFVSQGGTISQIGPQLGAVVPGLFLAYGLLAIFGLGIGTLVRNQIGGVILALGLTLVVEPLIVIIFKDLVHVTVNFLPSRDTAAVAGGLHAGHGGTGVDLLSWWEGGLALLGWGLGAMILGYFTTFKRDVS